MVRDVFFATDAGYVKHLAVALKSFLINGKGKYRFHIINGGLDSYDWNILKEIASYHKSEIFNHYFDDSYLEGVKINFHFKKSNYYRLFMEDFCDSDKVLYLDADIVVDSNIDQIFEYDIEDYYLAAVENPGFKRHKQLNMDESSSYFNSGVMLVNLKKWKINGIKNEVINFVKEFPESIEFVDQCGLNAVVNGNWLKIHPKFNLQSAILENYFSCFTIKEINDAIKSPVCIHYTGSKKPWNYCVKHKYRKLYWSYRSMTKYSSFLSDDFNFLKLIKCLTPKFIKKVSRRVFK